MSDSGPLIALGRLDLLDLLSQLFEDVQVPQQVLAECVARPELADAQRIQAAVTRGVLHLCEALPIRADGLELGESAAIGRAIEIGAALLADDLAARQHAQDRGLTVIGTLGVLVRAKRRGLVPQLRPLIEHLRSTGQRLSHSAVAEALTAAGE